MKTREKLYLTQTIGTFFSFLTVIILALFTGVDKKGERQQYSIFSVAHADVPYAGYTTGGSSCGATSSSSCSTDSGSGSTGGTGGDGGNK